VSSLKPGNHNYKGRPDASFQKGHLICCSRAHSRSSGSFSARCLAHFAPPNEFGHNSHRMVRSLRATIPSRRPR
jgi:hypothetical protein